MVQKKSCETAPQPPLKIIRLPKEAADAWAVLLRAVQARLDREAAAAVAGGEVKPQTKRKQGANRQSKQGGKHGTS